MRERSAQNYQQTEEVVIESDWVDAFEKSKNLTEISNQLRQPRHQLSVVVDSRHHRM